MNEDKRKRLEAAGWRVGSADEFLGWYEEREAFLRASASCSVFQTPDVSYTLNDGLPITTGCCEPGCEPDSGKSERMCIGGQETPPDGPDIRSDADEIRLTAEEYARFWKGWELDEDIINAGIRNRVLMHYLDLRDLLREQQAGEAGEAGQPDS